MKPSIRQHALVTLLLCSSCSWAGGLCRADERALFSCRAEGKVIALCASTDVSHESGYVQFRFGTPQDLQVEFPSARVPPVGNFTVSSTAHAGGGEARVRFRNDGVTYYIYERTIRSTPSRISEGDFEAGIAIDFGARGVAWTQCSPDSVAGLAREAYEVFDRETWTGLPKR